MRIAETVTFGGSGLDRAAELRGDPERMAALLAEGLVLPIWRGKPLMRDGAALGWVAADSPVLAGGGAPIFLGRNEGRGCFAVDISDWSPEAGAEAVQAGFFDPSFQTHPALPESLAFGELRGAMLLLTPREAELAATGKALVQWHRSHGYCSACGAVSAPAMAGWQRVCTVCAAHHFPRTDPVVIMLVTHGNRALIGRSPGWPEGMYSCLAGFVEPGETIEAAVRREVFEEAGVRVGAVRYLASQPWPFPASLMIGCHGEALTDAITLDPVELEEARWISREEMVTVMAGAHPEVRPARKGAIAHFLIAAWLADRLD
ncbi:NAD+ diphosphatase [Cereibacter changlensis]|uniref:NAD(+) diphosphatase n=3 Tax=Cereibacter changlensis TaxID=402884 RepID=A0A2W7QXP1_9RHOB|nr:NAD(+) diphosphatase [Cereibacter changlensis]PZX50820.1 NAD+ diphosphatase [Cereibacter changlensis]